MNEYNCAVIFGSLVHRAQGYKRLRDEVIMSQSHLFSMNTLEKTVIGLVTKNMVVQSVFSSKYKTTLILGSLVIVKNLGKHTHYAKVEMMNNELKLRYDLPASDVYWCPLEGLVLLESDVLNLVAAVSSPEERVRITRDTNLLSELLAIETGTIVRVVKLSLDGIVTDKRFMPELGPGIFFEVELLDDNNGTLGERCNYFPANELRVPEQMYLNKKSKDSYVARNRNEFALDRHHSFTDTKISGESSTFGAKSNRNNRFRPGDRIVWQSETGATNGQICWRSAVGGNRLQVHLNSDCKEISCDRSKTNSLSVNEVTAEDECNKKFSTGKNNVSQTKNVSGSNDVRVGDLLGIDQLDNCSTYKQSYASVIKDYDGDEVKSNKDTKKYSSNALSKGESRQSSHENLLNVDDLGIGSMVEVPIGDERHYGVIKFIGPVSYGLRVHQQLVAGVEMEEENKELYGDGCISGTKYFDCAPYRGTFTLLSECKKDSRFQDTLHPYAGEMKAPEDFGKAVIPGIVEPINQLDNIHMLCGKYKGVQGHNNSCYLDATLFSMFTFTSVFDDLLYRPANETDIQQYGEVQRVLREEIVNPLRKNLFVRSDRVMKLRTLLDSLTSVTGLTCEEKDPEEFLTSLVAQVLKAEPYLKLSSGHEAYYYQLFVEKDERLKLPTVQQLFEQSFITSDIKLKEVPSCLIIQMPRFGKSYKMYPRILPTQLLDVTDVIENSPRQCSACAQQLALYECKECVKDWHELACFSFCQNCVKTFHLHDKRNHHKYTRIAIPREFDKSTKGNSIPRHFMELFAVLCIETSHYVAFVKCGLGPDTPWCFFDSMADRRGGPTGYNIPEMVLCPDLPLWLSDGGAQVFCEMKDDRHLDPYAKRLLCDAYMCLYQSTDVIMYR